MEVTSGFQVQNAVRPITKSARGGITRDYLNAVRQRQSLLCASSVSHFFASRSDDPPTVFSCEEESALRLSKNSGPSVILIAARRRLYSQCSAHQCQRKSHQCQRKSHQCPCALDCHYEYEVISSNRLRIATNILLVTLPTILGPNIVLTTARVSEYSLPSGRRDRAPISSKLRLKS